MGFTFFETMSGEFRIDHKPMKATVWLACEVPQIEDFNDGVIRLDGVIHINSWADDLPLSGELRVSFLRRKTLEYELRFDDHEGRKCRIEGRKDLGITRRLLGMTHLNCEVFCESSLVGSGYLEFDLRDLMSFLSSPQAGTSARHLPIADGPEPEDVEALRMAMDEFISPGAKVPAVSETTLKRTLKLISQLPPHAQKGYWAALHAYIAIKSDGLKRVVSLPIMIGHFGRRDYLDAIGVPAYDNPVREPRERWHQQLVGPEALESESTIECDVVVVGTGAGGAPLAASLAEKGFAVALVEEGKWADRSDFSGELETRISKFWRDSGLSTIVSNAPLLVPTGRVVGGTTLINSGTSFGTPHAVLKEWRDLGFGSDFEPDNFNEWTQKVARELGIAPAQDAWLGAIAGRVAAGAEHLRDRFPDLEHGPLPRNAPGCDGQGLCTLGCPTGAKRSTDQSWVPRALKAGAQCFTGLRVARVLMRGDKAVGVVARGLDEFGVHKELRIKARAVVVSCGTFGSPILLKESGVQLPALGKNLSVHPALGVIAEFPHSLGEPWRAIPQSYGVHGVGDSRIRYEGFYVPPGLMAAALGEYNDSLNDWMDSVNRVGQFGFMVRDRGVGTVRRGPGGRPIVTYKITPDVLSLMKIGLANLCEMMLAGGAERINVGVRGVGDIGSLDQGRALSSKPIKPWHLSPMAFHPLGTCAMGVSAKSAVVDLRHQVFGTEGLYVVDGASVPSSLGVNPQVTIMSMALRAADLLAQDLS